MKEIYIIGAGSYGEAMYELAEQLGYRIMGFYDEADDKQNITVMGAKVVGKFSQIDQSDILGKNFIVAIGNNKTRFELMEKINLLGGFTPTLIHPKATISNSAQIGNGVYIQAGAVLWTKVEIGNYCIISPNVVVAHHTKVGRACLVSTLSGIGANIDIQDRVFIGMGATVMTGVKSIGSFTTIGAGAVVIRDLPGNCLAVGCPAKPIKMLTKEE